MNNEDRAKAVGVALQAFAKATGMEDEGPETIAGDFIANVLHWVVSREHGGSHGGALYAARNGIANFVGESYDEDDGPDAHVSISIKCEGFTWFTQTGEEMPVMPTEFTI